MSLRWRILGAFLLIIVLAISFGVGISYVTTQQQLDTFVKQLSRVEAEDVARHVGQEYTASGGWETIDEGLSTAGYLYEEIEEREGGSEHEGEGEGQNEGSEEESEAFHIDRVRIVITNLAGSVVRDNFDVLKSGEEVPPLEGHRTAIVDSESGELVGYAYVDVNQEYLATESYGLLRSLLISSLIGGLLTAAIALLLAAWLSRRITAPVIALTEATQEIAQQGEAELLPVTSSDELGRMSAAFNQMTTSLQTQRDLRKRLIDDLSHEINTPLSVVQLEAKGLCDGLQTPEKAADQITQEVNMLRGLVRDLNWLAETDSGELRLAIEPCPVGDLLTTEVARWQPQAQTRQVSLTLEPLPPMPTLDLDPMRLSQALGNILHNSLQHTEPGGRIIVAASADTGSGVAITVADDGAGIDAADLPYIFDRLYRSDDSRSRRTGGAGLGLAITSAIVEAHGGTIFAASNGLGRGTTILIQLPAAYS